MSSKKLNIFIHPVDGAGHINACIGLGQTLAERGHRITVLTGSPFASIIENYGFRVVIRSDPPSKVEEKPKLEVAVKSDDPLKETVETMLTSGFLSNLSPLEKLGFFVKKEGKFFAENCRKCIHFEPQIKAEIEKERPDLFIVDNILIEPTILHSNIPWIYLISGNPLGYYRSENLPPSCSGFSVNSDKKLWKEFRIETDKFLDLTWKTQNDLLRHFGYPEVSKSQTFMLLSDYLNIYGYPEELDYEDEVPRPDNFVRVDAFCRKSPVDFNLPDEFKNRIKPGDKLIYFSLGSMGSFSVPLMQSIINVLAKTPHKYIVSLGPLHAHFELPDNMYGEQFLPQTALLSMVDLVITHGGNNTVTESFNFGKPMIVMPLFGDQYDNAQRVQDKGFGVRINPFDFDETVLIESIDKLLFDTELNLRLQTISQRIQHSNSKKKACIAIEQMVQTHKDKQQ